MSAATTNPAGLMPALLAVQAASSTLPKDKTNPHFGSRFTPLDTIVEIIGPLLAEHGLVWTTLPGRDDDGTPILDYRLIHASTGETLSGRMPLYLGKQDAQSMGSALTYARRYSISAVLNLVADEDEDGNGAARQPSRQASSNGLPPTPELAPENVTALLAAIKRARIPADWVRMQLVAAGAQNVPDGPIMQSTIRALTEEQAKKVIDACDEVTATREKAEAKL